MTRLVIGKPVLGKAGANEAAKQAFSGAKFPLSVTVVNKMTIRMSLPEAGIMLRPLASAATSFHNFDRLQRAVSSLEQIARLNDAKELVVFEYTEVEGEPKGDGGDGGDDDEPIGGDDDEPIGGDDLVVTVIQDDEEAFIVELQGVRFEPLRNQVRDNGTLTTGGVKAFEEAKANSEPAE